MASIPTTVSYTWTQADRDVARRAPTDFSPDPKWYVTPYRIPPWNIGRVLGELGKSYAPDARDIEAGRSFELPLRDATAEPDYVLLFLHPAFSWKEVPDGVGAFSSVQELCGQLLGFSRGMFPPERYDLAARNVKRTGGLGIVDTPAA